MTIRPKIKPKAARIIGKDGKIIEPKPNLRIEHYRRPEVKELILRLCHCNGGSRALNGDDGWYKTLKDGKVRLRGPKDYDSTVFRSRSLYITADVFDPSVFNISEKWEDGQRGEGRPANPIGTRGDLIAYTLFADIDATEDPNDPSDENGKPRSKVFHQGRKEALEAAASFMVNYLRERGISGSVRVAFSGQGVYVFLHPGLSDMSSERARPDFDRDMLDRDFKIWLEAFNALLTDIERSFFEAHPEHAGKIKFDKLNNQKRKVKCLLSLHRQLPFAVVPLDNDHIEIDFEAARIPLSSEMLKKAREWLDTWESSESERHDLTVLLKPYKTKAVEEITAKANTSGEIRRSSEHIPVERWCPFYKALLNFPGGTGANRVCGALATWLYQAGWQEEPAFEIWETVADRCNVESRIFYTSYGVINSPSCKTIQKTSAGYPSLGFGGLGLCTPDEKCKKCGWPGDYCGEPVRTLADVMQDIEKLVETFNADPVAGAKNESILKDLRIIQVQEPVLFDQIIERITANKSVKKSSIKAVLKTFSEKEQQKWAEERRNTREDEVEAQRVTVQDAIMALAAQCDGAKTCDSVGYNNIDPEFFRPLIGMIQAGEEIPDDRLLIAYGKLKKYSKQLAALGIDYDMISIPGADSAAEFTLEDFCYDANGKGKYQFSRAQAAEALLAKLDLAIPAGRSVIYWFNGQIYQPTGANLVSYHMYNTARDLVNRQNVTEVVDRITKKLLLNPVTFDPDPYLLGVRNGVVDLRTGKFREYRSEDLITDQIDVAYDPEARCPRFLKFLEEIQPNVVDRMNLVDWYVITAIRKPLPYVLFLLGIGRNGKGVYEKVIMRFFGRDSFSTMALDEINKSVFAASSLDGKRGWIASEQGSKKRFSIGTNFIKLISGADGVDADVKYEERRRFQPILQIVVDTNAMPVIEDTSRGWMERFCKQSFPYFYVDDPDPDNSLERKKDPRLYDKLTTDEELSGILNLLIYRAQEISKTEIIIKRPARELFDEYSKQSSSLTTFWDEFCEYDDTASGVEIPTDKIYDAYRRWCPHIVGEVVDDKRFGAFLKRQCGGIDPRRKTVDGKKIRFYPGLLFDEDKLNAAIEAIDSDRTIKDQYGPLKDHNKSLNSDISRDTGPLGPLNLWELLIERFSKRENTADEPQTNNDPYKEKNSKINGPNGPLDSLRPHSEDPGDNPMVHNGSSNGPLDSLRHDSRNSDASVGGEREPEPYETIAENLVSACKREAEHLEKFATPLPKPKKQTLKDSSTPTQEELVERVAMLQQGSQRMMGELEKLRQRRQAEKGNGNAESHGTGNPGTPKIPPPDPKMPKASEDEGPVFGLSMPFWRKLARQHNGLNSRVIMTETGYDESKADISLNGLRDRGWIEDESGRLHPPSREATA